MKLASENGYETNRYIETDQPNETYAVGTCNFYKYENYRPIVDLNSGEGGTTNGDAQFSEDHK